MAEFNRYIQPPASKSEKLKTKDLETFSLKNGIKVYCLNIPNIQVLKLDLVFSGGLINQQQPGQATATSSLITEGSSNYSAKEIAEGLDQYGSYLQSRANLDDSEITLYCLPKFFRSCLSYIHEVLFNPVFPEEEIITYKKNALQRFQINKQRNNFIGRRAFYESLFGKNNAYGNAVNEEDYNLISRETLLSFYNSHYPTGLKYIMVTGSISTDLLDQLNQLLGDIAINNHEQKTLSLPKNEAKELFIENTFSVQSSMRIGKPMPTRMDPSYTKLQLLNLLIGGFFGSRLMKNIREEKGLTYGIFSALESFQHSGTFYIETEINNKLRLTGKEEIFKELARVREELVPKEELVLVKNYMVGSFMRGLDGPFSLADRYKMIIDYGFTYDYFQNFVDVIESTTAQDIQILAQEYLKEESLTTIIVGNK